MQNILITSLDPLIAKVGDFGLSKLLTEDAPALVSDILRPGVSTSHTSFADDLRYRYVHGT